MSRRVPPVVVVAVCLALLALGYLVLPSGSVREAGYPITALTVMLIGGWGVHRWGEDRPSGWVWVVAGFTGWAFGDLLYLVEQNVLGLSLYPAPSDAVYFGSYALLVVGLVQIVRRQGVPNGFVALLDGAILAIGTAVVAGVFVITPIFNDSGLSVLGKLTSSLYPVVDVLLLGILVRLWGGMGSRTPALGLLAAGLGTTLAGDILYTGTSIVTGRTASSWFNDLLWLSSYFLVTAAVWSPSARKQPPSVDLRGREELTSPPGRFTTLTAGLLLPAVTLLVDGLDGGGVSWAVIAIGSATLSILVLLRMAGLLTVVRSQATQLAALARSDPLTGLANRRTLEFELLRACRVAREQGTELTVVMIDIDHFKRYNDTLGHPAGDLLLREATAAWSALLHTGEVMARYGGEEFVVLLPGLSTARAHERVTAMLAATPHGQTFSAGLAAWQPGAPPESVLAAADAALYVAKRGGRNQVRVAGEDDGAATTQAPLAAS